MKKDYYEILGVSKDASIEDIKKAYRKVAREHHPDVAQNKEEAEKKFKEINEAYRVLSDPEKKAQYDKFGHSAFSSGSAGPYGSNTNPFSGAGGFYGFNVEDFSNFDPFEIFESVFGFKRNQTPKGKNLYYTLQISFSESVLGTKKSIRVGKEEFDVNIPPGVSTGTELKIPGKGGEPLKPGYPRGDLYISIQVEDLPNIYREGYDIYIVEHIPLTTSLLGGKIKVPAIDTKSKTGLTKIVLKIPPGTQSNTNFKVSSKGMPKLRGEGRGDLYVKILVDIPAKLTKKQKDLIKELQKEGL